jgi:2-C-methyl-D-erythritol 4-phosphate cytidylyltransferase
MFSIILLAAGSGSRFSKARPKQFELFEGVSALLLMVRKFLDLELTETLVVVINPKHFEELLGSGISQIQDPRLHFCFGGETRASSLRNAFAHIIKVLERREQREVIVHDSCRPFLSGDFLDELVRSHEPGIPTVTFHSTGDSKAIVSEEGVMTLVPKSQMVIAFHTPIIISPLHVAPLANAFEESLGDGVAAFLVENGFAPKLVRTDGSTKKVTYPGDEEY